MNEHGTLQESNGRYALRFERSFHHNPEDVFLVITKPSSFAQWYPFATGEMDLRLGGMITQLSCVKSIVQHLIWKVNRIKKLFQ
ncbi:SRPBCC domain-containing protein [Paenibacillus pabuli]|nr:SRPBCC domain-containing protein [Paenibacillus pabuli]MEC0126522.1 SRPBCC domain-containing protein [Paenibacillus pabuli]